MNPGLKDLSSELFEEYGISQEEIADYIREIKKQTVLK